MHGIGLIIQIVKTTITAPGKWRLTVLISGSKPKITKDLSLPAKVHFFIEV
jgi:hypothetical protein